MIETLFRQQSDSSYKSMIRLQNFHVDHLLQTNQATRIVDRDFTIDPNIHMLVVDFQSTLKSSTRQCKTKI
jgi:hypothetical protein